MARTGRFGRAPRSAPNLTNTLIAIAREAERQRDQNIMDAWQQGGMFEGKKATDELVLAHWKGRIAGVSKDDPLYDTYKNAHSQLDYQIHESKMTASYATKGKTDAQMVAFYLGWAKKVPRNSEFWRVLQRDAGQYMRAAKSTSQVDVGRAKELAYNNAQTDTYNTRERASEYITDIIRRMAQSGHAGSSQDQLIAGPGSGSDFAQFDINDPEDMIRLIQLITPTSTRETTIGGPGARKPSSETTTVNGGILFHDDSGNPVTGQDVADQLAKFDPNFTKGQAIDLSYVQDLAQTQIKGLDERIARAKKTGHMTDVSNLEKQKTYFAMVGRMKNAWPIQQSYNMARATYDSVVGDPSASPQAILKAWGTYQNELFALAGDSRIEADDATRSRLTAEANGQTGSPTLAESFTGLVDGQFDGTATDSGENARQIEFMQGQVDAVKTSGGAVVWTNGVYNADGSFTPQAGGPSIGAGDYATIATAGTQAKVVFIPDTLGGGPIPVLMQGIPVKAAARDANGADVPPGNNNPLAMAYDITVGGKTTTVYGFDIRNADGTSKTVYSTDPPWNDTAKVTNVGSGGNHIEVTLDRFVPQLDQAGLDSYGAGGPVQGAAGWQVQGATYSRTTGKWTGGKLAFDPAAAAFGTDERNALGVGAIDPNTDFFSPTLAALMSDAEGRSILKNLDSNAVWKAQLQADAQIYAGFQPDPATPGAWMPPDAGQQARFDEAMGQANAVQSADRLFSGLGDFLTGGLAAWQRTTTGTPFKSGSVAAQPGEQNGFAKLATDLVKGTPFEVLGSFFQMGTNLIKPPVTKNAIGSPDERMEIKLANPITVPQYTPYKPPVKTQAGVTQQTSTQTYNVPGGTSIMYQPPVAPTYTPQSSYVEKAYRTGLV